jgi:hypothetical protein
MLNLKEEAYALAYYLGKGDACASHYLARLIEADTQGAFQPFAQALAARVREQLERWAELGVLDLEEMLEDEMYQLFKATAIDWDGWPGSDRPDEET